MVVSGARFNYLKYLSKLKSTKKSDQNKKQQKITRNKFGFPTINSE